MRTRYYLSNGTEIGKSSSDAEWVVKWCDWCQLDIDIVQHEFNILRITRQTWGNPASWWRHQMETFSALLALCEGNSPVTGEFPTQRPVTRSFDVFFDLRLNKRLSKQSWGWRFETPSRSLWRNCNDYCQLDIESVWLCVLNIIWITRQAEVNLAVISSGYW